ncbi:tRNA pseudouridine(65) synthase TruC [Pseudidiomarina taiwanensis]|uniref:tRNA pseudouridine synthase C n=1 Tax=Pseudidiomarina taiwanensis TaxID=337250 RepID=A0A432ZNM1_9GAMM|nr:tRNA pseudouridine(65) synthase TruC [Pseudidiomarina taiwanensis]RUO79495.1 tRNA pseudouridine(65) synthase TruC [Pseudidiomarina taiwanensis]
MSELTIVYDDDALIVVDKPAGLLVHRSWLAREAQEFALQKVRDQIGQWVYPVHRLDRPTSGLLLFAKSAELAEKLAVQFRERHVQKTYHAVVRGYLGDGELDYPLREELDKIADRDVSVEREAQAAVTRYTCLQQVELPVQVGKRHATSRYSLMQLHPLTGRKHQLRRHMSHLRHPIVGDSRHGDGRHNRFFREHLGIERLLLAATGLCFEHPITRQQIELKLEVPAEFTRIFSPEFSLFDTTQ